MEAGAVWIRVGLIMDQFKAGLAETKVEMVKWRDETNANTKEWMKWGRAITATVAPVVAVGTAMYAAAQKYGTMAQELQKLSAETGKTVTELQKLEQAENQIHGVDIYTPEQITQFAALKSNVDSTIAKFDHLIGKGVLWTTTLLGFNLPTNALSADLDALAFRMANLKKGFDEASKKAQEFADKIKKAKQEIRELSESIIDSGLSIEGERFSQADLEKEYRALEKELKLAELQADPETSGGKVYADRVKEIKARMERLAYEMRLSQRSVTKSQDSITAAGQSYRDININIYAPKGTPSEISEATLNGLRIYYKYLSLEGMS